MVVVYPSTFHNGEPAKSTLLPSKRVLNGSDVADWALVAPCAENGMVAKISNQIIFSQCVVGFCGSCWKLFFDLGRVAKQLRMEGSAMNFWPGTHRKVRR